MAYDGAWGAILSEMNMIEAECDYLNSELELCQ